MYLEVKQKLTRFDFVGIIGSGSQVVRAIQLA